MLVDRDLEQHCNAESEENTILKTILMCFLNTVINF